MDNEDHLMSESCGPGILDLASELLAEISSYLSSEDLNTFRAAGNRILSCIDFVYRQRHFRSRVCHMDDASIERLCRLTKTHFAESITSITFGVDTMCEVIPDERSSFGGLRPAIASPLEVAPYQLPIAKQVCLRKLPASLDKIFARLPNLKCINIYAPSLSGELRDGSFPAIFDPRLIDTRSRFTDPFGGGHYLDIWEFPICAHGQALYSEILIAIAKSRIQLEEFRMLGFTQPSCWRRLAPGQPTFEYFVREPRLQRLTHLEIDLEHFPYTITSTMPSIVRLIRYNATLRVLKVRGSERTTEDEWGQLLERLAYWPVFRLRELYLTRATIKSKPTMGEIIRFHAKTLRHFVLNEVVLGWPNTIRSIYSALSHTQVDFFATRALYEPNRKLYVTARRRTFCRRKDMALEWDGMDAEGLDRSFQDWCDIRFEKFAIRDWVTWYDGRAGEEDCSIKTRMQELLGWMDVSPDGDY